MQSKTEAYVIVRFVTEMIMVPDFLLFEIVSLDKK